MARKTLPYHRRYQGDALQGYTKLTLEERGAYTTFLDLIYDAGGPIEYNERWLAGQLNCSLRKMKALLSRLLTLQKLYITVDGRISNHRCERELAQTEEHSRKQAEKRAKPRANAAETWRDPYGLARGNAAKTSRKQVENDLKPSPNSREKPEKANENSQTRKPQLIHRSTLPEPEPYKNNSTTVVEDTLGAEEAGEPPLRIAAVTSDQRLIDALNHHGEGRYQLQSELARGRQQRRGGS